MDTLWYSSVAMVNQLFVWEKNIYKIAACPASHVWVPEDQYLLGWKETLGYREDIISYYHRDIPC